MNILAHPMFGGEYIVYVLDPNNKPYTASLTDNRDKISSIARKFSKKYKIDKAEYIDDYRFDSDKPRWKILL